MANKRRFTTTQELAFMQAPMPPLIFTFHHDPSQLSSSSLEMTVIHGEAPDDEDEGYEKNNNKIQEQNSTRSLPKKVLHFHSIYGLII